MNFTQRNEKQIEYAYGIIRPEAETEQYRPRTYSYTANQLQ
jgi:hypothetical protein